MFFPFSLTLKDKMSSAVKVDDNVLSRTNQNCQILENYYLKRFLFHIISHFNFKIKFMNS